MLPDEVFARRLGHDATALRARLAMPLFCAASCPFDGGDQTWLDTLAGIAARGRARLLAVNDVRFHDPARRRLADVLTAIRLDVTVDRLRLAAEPNAERCLKAPAESSMT
ncbi:hypothetical protein ACQW02_17275 [Humitalea sp. 24SJ18S-53]|uniref:hypothetical protein n=1 Tax=Humitalea sp. 24SJ18S-53 TaxID=3422307 RepID=UPI003D678163